MKQNYLLCLAISILIFPNLVAQELPGVAELKKNYLDHFELNRETPYLHLNKTFVIPGENLWLSAYVYNSRLELPNEETANLELEIYNANGKHIDTKTLYISNGKGSGFLTLDTTSFPPGEYVLRAATQYMKNFKEDLSFEQAFTILGNTSPAGSEQSTYDLRLLPEGGHLLSGTVNSVGVKLTDQSGAGAAFGNARLLDSEGREITTFKSNRFGMSKFFFTPILHEEYRVLLEGEDGQQIEQKLPPAKETGINLVSTIREKEHILSLRTNGKTRELIKNSRFLLVVHKAGNFKELEFALPEDELEMIISMPKDSLFPGVNTVTIFDNNLKPIAERLIFSGNTIKRSRLEARIGNRTGDSIKLELQALPAVSRTSLSISVLPSGTLAYNPEHNIISAFQLKPYIRGPIDEVAYYFSPGEQIRKEYDLDLLLLSQGWSKYDWANSLLSPPKEVFPHEIGFRVKGSVTSRNEKRENSLFVGSDDTNFFQIANIGEDGTFEVDRAFLLDSTEIDFGLMDSRNNKLSPPSLEARVYPIRELKDLDKGRSFIKKKKFQTFNIPEAFEDSPNTLDTVMLTGKKRKDPVFNPDLQIHARGFEITDEIARRHWYITDYIATKGFQVRHINGWVEIKSLISSTIPKPADVAPKFGRTAESNVMLYFNGAPMGSDASFLIGLLSADVESIIINKRGYGYGGNGVNGVIHINTKQGGFTRNQKETVRTLIANNGYLANKEFYTPKYKTYSSTSFNQFGVVDWKPFVTLNDQGRTEISIPNRGPVSLFVEGMGADGTLIYEELKVEPNR